VKTVVIGVFDEPEGARRVLHQLADSPLDLRSVSVLHRDANLQAALSEDAGLPQDRSLGVLVLVGAVLGAAAGAWLGAPHGVQAIAGLLGPALAGALGALIGAALAAVFGTLLEPLGVPPEHQQALSGAIDAGATGVIVQTHSVPTARAISDLFHSAGARDLGLAPPSDPAEPSESAAPGDLLVRRDYNPDRSRAGTPLTSEDVLFQPPERRGGDPGAGTS
jgi:hypothetical protein